MSKNIVRNWNSKVIRQREDGYLSGTDMALANNKLIGDWMRLKSTNAFLHEMSSVMGIPITDLVELLG